MLGLDENASAAWLASTVPRKLSATALEQINISATARRVLNPRQLKNLRVEGHLMYGVARLIAQKVNLLAAQTQASRKDLDRELEDEPTAQETSSDDNIISQTQTLDMISSGFDLERIIDEFRPTQPEVDDFDMGDLPDIDDELRADDDLRGAGDEGLLSSPSASQAPVLSAGDEEILRNILGTQKSPEPAQMDQAEFPSSPELHSLHDEEASSSPQPQEAITPEPEELHYEQEPEKVKKKRSKRLCPVDTSINLPRNRVAVTTVLTTAATRQVEDEEDDDTFFDPQRISDIIKRRKLAAAQGMEDDDNARPDLEKEHNQFEPDISNISMDGLLDDPMDDGMDDYEGPAGTQLIGSLEESQNVEDLMAQEIRIARLRLNDVKEAMVSELGHTRRSKAAMFSEVLAQATRGTFELSQDRPYGEIYISRV